METYFGILAKPQTYIPLSFLPWDIKSNKEPPAWASVAHTTEPEGASQGWDKDEAGEAARH